jgi:hypothetical protein
MLYEVMAWSEYLIQQNCFSSILYPQAVTSTKGLLPPLMFHLGTSSNNAFADAHATAGWSNFTITLRGQIVVETAVVIPN